MLTLQILDGSESFLRPLDGHALTLGSGAAADVRLDADGVVDRHARVEFEGETPWLCAIDGAVRLNGRPVTRAALALGDRIELGTVVVVVGRSVARRAVADDVLAAAPRRSVRRPLPKRRPWLVPAIVAGVAAAGLLGYAMTATGTGLPVGFLELDRLRRAGSFELARAQVDRLRRDWAVDAARRQQLLAEAERIERTAQLVRDRRQQILDVAAQRTYAEISTDLQRDERSAADEEVRVAARIVRASLYELLRNAASALPPPTADQLAKVDVPPAAERPPAEPTPAKPPTPVAPAPAPEPVAVADEPPARHVQEPQPASGGPDGRATVTSADVDAVMADTTNLVASGRFRQAHVQLQLALAGATEKDAAVLRQRVVDLRATAKRLADQLIERARNEAAAGRFDTIIADLAAAIDRFPAGEEFAGLTVMLDLVQREQRASGAVAGGDPLPGVPSVDAATRRATLATVGPALESVRASEALGDYAAAAAALGPAVAAVKDRDPDYAAQLQQRLDELQSIAALHVGVTAFAGAGTRIDLPLRGGSSAQLQGVLGCHLLVWSSQGEREIAWAEVAPAGLLQLAAEPRLPVEARLGAAALLYRSDAAADAENVLAQVLKAEAALKERVDHAIARGRGEALDPRGYRLTRDGFVAVAQLEAEKNAGKVLARLDPVLRGGDAAARDAWLTDVLALGPSALRPVVSALQRALDKDLETLERSPLQQQVERLAAQRAQLDEARAFAKQLIFDEVKYFYPYRPPQVPSDRYTEYMRVQGEVDDRVAAVRAIWDDDRLRVRVPGTLIESLARLDWLTSSLRDLGELDPLAVVAVDWARALPDSGVLTVRDLALSAAERDQFAEWDRIDAYNQRVADQLDAGEREQVAVTNAYRRMFGHRPLAVDLRLRAAAHGHAEEMSKLGYFSHFSPTAGRRTPSERMLLAGYQDGVSENIALNDSATGAHVAWCHSSGHHRNLLMASHTEFGTSGAGRNWVQNFGHGTGYAAAMAAAKPKPR